MCIRDSANTVAISTSATVGNNLTVTSTTNSANLNVTGVGTLTRAFATDLSVSGISTISQPSNANPHSLWDVVNNSSSSYRFTGPGVVSTDDNPNIYLVRGQRYIFKINASSHPFYIKTEAGTGTGNQYTDGVTGNGAQSGNITFNVQHDAPPQLKYQCSAHGSMVGNIYIVGGPQVISGITTLGNVVVGGATTDLVVNGDARVTGILTIGQSSLTLDGTNNTVNVGTALTLGHTNGVQFHTQNLHSTGFEVNQINASGIITATTFVGNLTGNPTGSGANLTNLPAANLTGTLPAISGANLTSLPAGLGTALGSGLLSNVFYFDKTLTLTSNTTINPPASASTAYTHFAEVELADGVELTIEDGDALLIDVLGLNDT